MAEKAILWFRKDLRLKDNEALNWAVKEGYEIIPFFHYNRPEESPWELGGASEWWLHHALTDFSESIASLDGNLVIGDSNLTSFEALSDLIESSGASAVFWNRRYEPEIIQRDKRIKQSLADNGIEVKSFNSSLLFEPQNTKNKSGKPYQVFTPFWKSLREHPIVAASDLNGTDITFAKEESTQRIEDLKLLPRIKWDENFPEYWTPTRHSALLNLSQFIKDDAKEYGELRDRPDLDGTSRMSPYLHFGQIGPKEMLEKLRATNSAEVEDGVSRQLFWREFSLHLMYHFPHSTERALRPEYDAFPWETNSEYLKAWQSGKTGFPIVDAAMRQLYTTGWMHNRCRMIVASFLVKHLLQPWQSGAEWFWDTLVDADLANNTMGWQWTAGCGADASPYFRIFNPITQGQKFDKTGEYVRKWCPELAKLPNKFLFNPWDAPKGVLEYAEVNLGENYPNPILTHEEGRQRSLDAYKQFKEEQA